MPKKRKFYMGNNPNSYEYDPNIPVGCNKWDAQEVEEENDTNGPDEEEIDESEDE